MAITDAVTFAGKSLWGDRAMWGDTMARGFFLVNASQIVHQTAEASGDFYHRDDFGDLTIGHKSEVFLSTTAGKAPALLNGGLTMYYGAQLKNFGNSETLNLGKGAARFVMNRFGTAAAETGAEALTADAAATTTVATNAVATTTLATDGIITGTTATGSGVFSTGAAITSTVGSESIITGTATTGSVFATETTIASTTALTSTAATTTAATTTTALAAGETTAVIAGETTAVVAGETTAVAAGGTTVVAGGAGLGATIASSVILPVAVAGAAYYTGKQAKKAVDIMVATHDTYAEVDSTFLPGKRAARFQTAEPNVANYKNIIPVAAEVSKLMRNENLSGPVTRLADGRIPDLHQIDFSDPKNRAELVRAIDQQIALDKATMSQNSSIMPRWLRSGDAVYKQEMARMDEHQMEAAKTDLASFGRESDQYLAAKRQFDQANPPVVTASTTPKAAPPKAG